MAFLTPGFWHLCLVYWVGCGWVYIIGNAICLFYDIRIPGLLQRWSLYVEAHSFSRDTEVTVVSLAGNPFLRQKKHGHPRPDHDSANMNIGDPGKVYPLLLPHHFLQITLQIGFQTGSSFHVDDAYFARSWRLCKKLASFHRGVGLIAWASLSLLISTP